MNTEVEQLLREGLDRLTAGVPVPAGLADRARDRRRRRRVAARSAIVAAAAAVTAAAVIAATGGPAGPAGGGRVQATPGPAVKGPAQASAYVVGRIENALANDDQVMRETISLGPHNGEAAGYFDGRPTYQSVTWSYQGRARTEFLGAHGQVQSDMGTGIVDGKLRGVQVDYILHQWMLIPGMLSKAPANACTKAGFGEAIGDPNTDWPLLIRRTLACGGYRLAGYAEIDGAATLKITGSQVVDTGVPGVGDVRFLDTLYVNPATYLPARITESATTSGPGSPGSLTSTDLQWLPPTPANRARASVTVPCGYQEISWPSGDPTRVPVSVCG